MRGYESLMEDEPMMRKIETLLGKHHGCDATKIAFHRLARGGFRFVCDAILPSGPSLAVFKAPNTLHAYNIYLVIELMDHIHLILSAFSS